MKLTLLNLPYCPDRKGFDDQPLRSLSSPILSSREHFYEVGGIPHLSLLIELADDKPAVEGHTLSSTPTSESSPDTPSRQDRRSAFLAEREQLGEAQRERFERLRSWRAHRAEAEGVPIYVVLTNKELLELARRNPSSKAALREIPGLGQRKVERYGELLLQLLNGDLSPPETPASSESPIAEARHES